jgi:ERCC4-type nuclease
MNLEETAEWLIQFALKLEKEGAAARPFYSSSSSSETSLEAPAEPRYAEAIGKRIKKDNITPENIGEIMLAQIPNVSCASAAAIMQKFSTLSTLIAALQSDTTSLNTIMTINKNGQQKKLTKPCINAIYDFLVKRTIINVDI